MKISLKYLGRTLFGLISVPMILIMVIGGVLLYPQLVINNRSFTWAVKKFGPVDYPITWTQVDVEARSMTWLLKGFSFRFNGLCIDERQKKALHGCFKSARIDFEAGLVGLVPRVTVLGPIEVLGGEVRADLDQMPKSPAPAQPEAASKPFEIPFLLRNAKVEPIRIDLPRLDIATGGQKLEGSLLVDESVQKGGDRNEARITAKVDARLTAEAGGAPQSVRAEVVLHNPEGMVLSKGWQLDASGAARLAGGVEADLRAEGRQTQGQGSGASFASAMLGGASASDSARADFRVDADYRRGPGRAHATLSGSGGRDGIDVKIDAEGKHLITYVDDVHVHDCTLTEKSLGSSGFKYVVNCPLRGSVPVPPKEYSLFDMPTRIGLRFSGELNSSTLIPSAESRLDGQVEAKLDPVLAPLFTGGGTVRARIGGRMSEFSAGNSVEAETDFFVKVPSFEKLVQKLGGTAWDVPAPLRVLKGSFEFEAKGNTNLKEGFFPSHFDTKLKSTDEALNINIGSTLEFDRNSDGRTNSKLQAKVVLSDVQLEMPRLELAAPPRFTPDSRIASTKSLKPATKKAAQGTGTAQTALAYEATVTTPAAHPVKILSNLAAAPIPVALDLKLDQTGLLSGPIEIQQFPVVLFRQKATIDHFTLTLKNPREDSAVDGLVKIPHGDYTILIYIVGTVDKPRVRVESDPPVPSNQLYSVLLYGESADSLNSTQAASTGNTQAAFSQGAMGLASLYLFASTPIQSVLYDPTTGQVTARLSLGGGASLNLGSNGGELSTVGVRKQLGPYFDVTTSVDPSKETPGAEIVTAFLEWIHRY
jgi:hypothetical protein